MKVKNVEDMMSNTISFEDAIFVRLMDVVREEKALDIPCRELFGIIKSQLAARLYLQLNYLSHFLLLAC